MIATLRDYIALSLRDPRRGMRAVLALPLGQGEAISLLTLVSIFSSLLLYAVDFIAPGPEPEAEGMMLLYSPFTTTGLQLGFLLFMSWLAYHIGQWRGGRGTLRDMVLVTAWLEALMLLLQMAQVFLLLLLPGLVSLLLPVTLAAFFWYLTNFITEAHGFGSLGKVFAGILLSMLVLSFALSFLLALLLGLGG